MLWNLVQKFVELSSSAKTIVFLPPKEVPSSLWVAAVQILCGSFGSPPPPSLCCTQNHLHYSLESEASVLRHKLTEKDAIIADLQSQLQSLDAPFSDASDKLTLADQEKDKLLKENETLLNIVKKLNRDVAKAIDSI
ncbi:unnamed protein product [Coffea canephora]|uniref:Uncharacterized protein n=1 Tax=Coffea canephora TaxID=49390 RepID=A0A068U1J7_COFCA|nr:unnamed protein product [Coffea canephora]